jgi:hypothetical protein
MKNIVFILGSMSLLVSCGGESERATENSSDSAKQETPVVAEEPAPQNSFILEPGVVGVFKIGQPISKLPVELNSRKTTVTRSKDGFPDDHLQHVIFNSLEDLAEITMEKNDNLHEEDLVIIDMRVISNYYETKEGVKVGTNITTLEEKYKDISFKYLGESGEIVAETETLPGIKFAFNSSACTKKLSGTSDVRLTSKNFTEDAKVEYILVN